MPQLDTIYTMMIYIWTWSVMYMTAQKIKNFTMTQPTMQPPTIKMIKTPPLQWL